MLAPDCDTDSDLTDAGSENEEREESNSGNCDCRTDESLYDKVDANAAIRRDNCAMWYNEHHRTRGNMCLIRE